MGLFTGYKFKQDSSLILHLDSFDHRSRKPDDLTTWTDIVSGTSFPFEINSGGTLDLLRKGWTSTYATNKLLSTGINIIPFKNLDSTGWTFEFIFKVDNLQPNYIWFSMTSTLDINNSMTFFIVNTGMPALQITGLNVLNDALGESIINASIFPYFFENIKIGDWNYVSFSYDSSTKLLLTQVNHFTNYGRANTQDSIGTFKTGWFYTIPNYIDLDFSTFDTLNFSVVGPSDNRGSMNLFKVYSRGLSMVELQHNWLAASNRIRVLKML